MKKRLLALLLTLVMVLALCPAALAAGEPSTYEEFVTHRELGVSNWVRDESFTADLYNWVTWDQEGIDSHGTYLDREISGVNRVNPNASFHVTNTAPAGTDCVLSVRMRAYEWQDRAWVGPYGDDPSLYRSGYASEPYGGMWDLYLNVDAGGFVDWGHEGYQNYTQLRPGEDCTFTLNSTKSSLYAGGWAQPQPLPDGTIVTIYVRIDYLEIGRYWRSGWNFLVDSSVPANEQEEPEKPATAAELGLTVNSWAKASVDKALAAGLYDEALGKDMTVGITRAQAAAVAVKLYEAMDGAAMPMKENPFTDTNDPNVVKAYSLGLIDGNGSGRFGPDDRLNREAVAVLLAKVYRKLGGTIPAASATKFADNAKISSWAKAEVAFMAEQEIVKGDGTNFNPQNDITGQEALILGLNMMNTLD